MHRGLSDGAQHGIFKCSKGITWKPNHRSTRAVGQINVLLIAPVEMSVFTIFMLSFEDSRSPE